MKEKILILFVLLSLNLFTACSNDEIGAPASYPVGERGDLIANQLLGTYSKETLNYFMNNPQITITPEYGVSVYKVVYTTADMNDVNTNVSGLIIVPNMSSSASFLSLQHGTIFKKIEAPSEFTFPMTEAIIAAAIGSVGYYTVVPDYLGFGESGSTFHPFVHAKSLALSVVDIIRAGKQFATENNVSINDKLFLAGYSEGGYATMAAHKEIEENYSDEITITASSPGAGPYDLIETTKTVISSNTMVYPAYFAYIVMAYKKLGLYSGELNHIFKDQYASKMEGLLDGSKTGSEINTELTTATNDLFQSDFITSFNGNGEEELKLALTNNSLHDWTPDAPIQLYHCTEDVTVPYQNSVTAYANFLTNGVTNANLEHEGGDHTNCDLLFSPVEYFSTF